MCLFIQTKKPYKQRKIDIIGLFKKFAYNNPYDYNLVDYFLRYMFSHSTFGIDINNIIILFNNYLYTNSKLYIVYINNSLYIIYQKLYKYF